MKRERLDCPYDFTSRCTMGRCDCKPKENTIQCGDVNKEINLIPKGYSEEDLEKAFKVGFTLGYVGDTLIADKDKCFNRWFKIFKNK